MEQLTTFEQFHDEVNLSVSLIDELYSDDVWVVQGQVDLNLFAQARQVLSAHRSFREGLYGISSIVVLARGQHYLAIVARAQNLPLGIEIR
jgi:hypothetical protein